MTYSSRPERKGYRLTEEGENLYAEWLDLGGCICFTGCAPCHVCVNEGHPISLEETDEVWEPELVFPEISPFKSIYEGWLGKNKDKSFAQQIAETEGGNDVSRSDVINVKITSPQVSPHPVHFASGSLLDAQGKLYGLYRNHGRTVESDEHFRQRIIEKMREDEKPPTKSPETKKEFKVGYWYKCVDSSGSVLVVDKYYQVNRLAQDNVFPELFVEGYGRGYVYDRFDVNSESSFNPTNLSDANNTCVGFARDSKIEVRLEGHIVPKTIDLTINVSKQTEEKQTMSNANRRVVNVKLLDNDSGLPVEYALVAQFQGIVTEDSDEVVKQEILLNKKIADAIAKHNEKRVEQTDLEILKRTGNDVKLRQVKLKDLTWIVSAA